MRLLLTGILLAALPLAGCGKKKDAPAAAPAEMPAAGPAAPAAAGGPPAPGSVVAYGAPPAAGAASELELDGVTVLVPKSAKAEKNPDLEGELRVTGVIGEEIRIGLTRDVATTKAVGEEVSSVKHAVVSELAAPGRYRFIDQDGDRFHAEILVAYAEAASMNCFADVKSAADAEKVLAFCSQVGVRVPAAK